MCWLRSHCCNMYMQLGSPCARDSWRLLFQESFFKQSETVFSWESSEEQWLVELKVWICRLWCSHAAKSIKNSFYVIIDNLIDKFLLPFCLKNHLYVKQTCFTENKLKSASIQMSRLLLSFICKLHSFAFWTVSLAVILLQLSAKEVFPSQS